MVKTRVLLDTKSTKSCPSIVAIFSNVISMPKPLIRAFLRSLLFWGDFRPIRTNFYQKMAVDGGLDKLTGPPSGRKVPFRIRAYHCPGSSGIALQQIAFTEWFHRYMVRVPELDAPST